MLVSCGKKNTSYKVFIFAGQSNMVGMGKTGELEDSLLKLPYMYSYYRQCNPDIWSRMKSFDEEIQNFGPEISFSHAIKKAFPNDSIIIIKCALGGASLYNAFYPGGSTKERANVVIAGKNRYDWFSKLISLIDIASLNHKCSFEGVFWMQGERDCRFEVPAKEYNTNLMFLADSIRSHYNSPDMIFISGRVNPPKDERYQYQNIVRKALETLNQQSPPASWIDCDNLSKHTDNLHYNTQGQLNLGRLFAEKYLKIHYQ